MRIWREVVHGLKALLRPRSEDRDVSDEVAHFMAEAERELVASGKSPQEARREVRQRYGDALTVRESARSYGWERSVETLLYDLRLSARSLRRSPLFAVVVVITLGIGVGATTSIVSAVHPVLLEPLGYPDADRVVSIADRGPDGGLLQVAFGTYRELVQRSRDFEALAVYKPWQPTLTGGSEPVRLEGQSVSASYFDVLGVRPFLGRGLDPAADRPDGAAEALLSDRLWRERFGADPEVVGRMVELDGRAVTVVGVMPADFENVTAPRARLWTLLAYDTSLPGFDSREWGRHLEMVGRLRPGVSPELATDALRRIGERPLETLPRPDWASMTSGFSVRRLVDAVVADVKPTMYVLLGAVTLLVVVTGANLTILFLARGAHRQGEFAMRIALGAGRRRLARYLLTEGLLLAGLGGAVGVAVAHVGLASLSGSAAAPSLPRIETVQVEGPALLLALAVTMSVGIVFGLAPGLHRATRRAGALHEVGRGATRARRTTRRFLVAAEMALATVLLVGAGLLLRTTDRLFSQPLGIDPTGVLVMQVYATGLEPGDAVTHRFFDEALAAVREVPGVSSAAMTSQLPLSGDVDVFGFIPDDPAAEPGTLGPGDRYAVTPEYFETMGVRILRGRALSGEDVAGAPRAAVVSASLADRLFPGRPAIGERVRVGPTELEPYTVVGVAADVKHASLASDPSESVYVTPHQWHWADRVRWMVVRAESDAVALAPAIREAIWSADANAPIVRVQSMDDLVLRSEARRRFVLLVLSAFALSALVVSAAGLFGVVSSTVAERTREMGVRAALGASREAITKMVVREGLAMATAGAAIGVGAAITLSGALSTLLFGVSRLDPFTYLGVVALLMGVAATASAVPAVRAGRTDPVDALRAE